MKKTCNDVFRAAQQKRVTNHPFAGDSAFKVRESLRNLQRESDVVASIAAYLTARPRGRNPYRLQGCTSEDKYIRVKRAPSDIAHELGYNLMPAIEGLTVDGVPKADVKAFVASITGRVMQLVRDCDAIQRANSRSIKGEYARLKAGQSDLTRACKEATDIGELAKDFCFAHGV